MTESIGVRQSMVWGISMVASHIFFACSSPSVVTANMRPLRERTSCMLEMVLR